MRNTRTWVTAVAAACLFSCGGPTRSTKNIMDDVNLSALKKECGRGIVNIQYFERKKVTVGCDGSQENEDVEMLELRVVDFVGSHRMIRRGNRFSENHKLLGVFVAVCREPDATDKGELAIRAMEAVLHSMRTSWNEGYRLTRPGEAR